jgi:hypothetical protein
MGLFLQKYFFLIFLSEFCLLRERRRLFHLYAQ